MNLLNKKLCIMKIFPFLGNAVYVALILYIGLFLFWFAAVVGCSESNPNWQQCGDNDLSRLSTHLYGWALK